MKTLYLVRHAKSSWKYPELDDFERPLNRRGRKSLVSVGELLKKVKAAPDLIISSPATRAATTARSIAHGINYPLEKILYSESVYMSDADILLHFIQDIDNNVKEAMIIGHNPALTDLGNYISNQQIGNIPTCGIFCVEFSISSWRKIGEGCGIFKFFEVPGRWMS
jgi:phosphohistidine phosphatase